MLTVRLGHDPIEALPSGPLEVEHRTLEVGLAGLGRAPDEQEGMSNSSTLSATATASKMRGRKGGALRPQHGPLLP
jgi:hypothetical protein